jgi:hypothetical protein
MFWDFSISTTINALVRTWPFVAARLVVYLGVALAYVIVTGTGASLGWGIGLIGDEGFRATSTFWGGIAGFGIMSAILYFLREWFLYMLKAGHIAVLVEVLDGRPLPEGRSQITHAQAVVRERFLEANVLFVIDQLVKGVIRAITGIVDFVARLLPVPGLRGLTRFLRTVVRIAIGFVDEVILAHNIRVGATNPYQGAQDALVLYAQNAVHILKNAVWLAAIVWGLTFVIFLIVLAPAIGIAYLFPGNFTSIGIVLAIVFAVSLKAAILEPFAIASLMQVYFSATEGQTPREDWRAHLDEASDKFRELGEKARGLVATPGAAQHDHVAPPAASPPPPRG